MNIKISILLAVVLIGSAVGAFILKSKMVNDTVSFSDVQVEINENVLDQIASGYVSMPALSADEDSIMDLIGAIAIRTQSEDGKVTWSFDPRNRPSRDLIKTKIIEEKLYHGIVSAKANFGGRFQLTSGDATGDELAEVTIRNQLVLGYKNQTDIPFQSLGKVHPIPNKDYFFIDNVIVTDITVRRFRKQTGDGKIKGMAFGANGSIYTEQDAVKTQKVVSFRPINVLDLQPGESGSGDDLARLIMKSRREQLTNEEASTLTNILHEKAKTTAPTSVPLTKLQSSLPQTLYKFEKLVWLEDIYPVKQSSSNRCWVAAIAMMTSWRLSQEIDENEAVKSLGLQFLSLYERDAPLPNSYKLTLLLSANLKYAAPQSYSENGLVSLLKDFGPVWFTIDNQFGRHATVLTGVFLDRKSNNYWVSYLDPSDGLLKADTYVSYMQRYEAPAFRANEEGIEVAMTAQDLDIQVIHW
ncbi:MAG: hypothetical protein IPH35_03995 [Rhodoferax sp.]|nr:hypothetical protein [Rhodoferax sp.]